MSASTGMVSAKNNGAGVSSKVNVSDTFSATETSTRALAKDVSKNVSVEGAALNVVGAPAGLVGEGTQSNPYQIGSVNDLLLMNSYINYEKSAQKVFALTRDIDLSGVRFTDFTECDGIWSLVSAKASLSGNANVYFRLNGAGHKLFGLNLTLSQAAFTGAIFGYINANSVIENLTIESCALRVNYASDGAFAVFAVQNCGTIRNCAMKDCILDARSANVTRRSTDAGWLSDIAGSRVYMGYALGVADNAGKVMNFTVSGSDANKGVIVKGGRRFVGVVAGQNRRDVSDASVSGVRVLSYGSEDNDSSVSGKGVVSAYVGGVVGRNDKTGTLSAASVTLKYGSDILFGDAVGGIAGENAGTIENAIVVGTSGAGASASSANLYGSGRYGAIAGVNSGTIRGSGAYDVGFSFSQSDGQNAYGGVAGVNSGYIGSCAASGSANLQNAASAGAGGLVGSVLPGTTLTGNYAVVSFSQQGANVGGLVGRDGTMTYVGQNNYWSSHASGVSTPVPNDGAGVNDLTAATPVIVLSESVAGSTINASALAFSWAGSSASVAPDFSKSFSSSDRSIRVTKSTASVTLVATNDGASGDLIYSVTISAPAGISGRKLSAVVRVPMYVTKPSAGSASSSLKNPIVLSSASQMQIMQYEPDAHYKLGADITLGSDWTPIDFSGTLDGDGHTLRISKPLFSSVSGSRNARVSAPDWRTDSSNLNSGYIYNLHIVPTGCVFGGVFGHVQNATVCDVTYAVGDENDGFVALSAAKSGALIDSVYGNAWLSNCTVSVPVAVTAGDAEGIGALVGHAIPNQMVVENCETTSLISLEKNIANVGGLIGNIVGGSTELKDCRATGCVYVSAIVPDMRANIMIGATTGGVSASGCTYAVSIGVANCSVAKEAAPFTDGITALKAESEEAKQGAEDARSMLSLIDPELIEEEPVTGALSKEGGVYKLRTAADVLEMMSMLNSGSSSDTYHTSIYEMQNDINMGGAEVKMATTADTAFAGTFRSASGHKYTLSNFTVTNTGSDATDVDTYPESIYYTATALFCYAAEATFQDIAISGATVVSDGVGTAVLVGFADKDGDFDDMGAYSECSFENIDITGCNVYSAFSVNGYNYAAENAALAGTLIGGVWGANGGEIYVITDITVTDCVVENRNWDSTWSYYSDCVEHTGGGSWSIGGLIGGSRLSDGTLCIGDENAASASVTLSHVTVAGYGGVGGVIGMAGTTSGIAGATSAVSASPSQSAAGGIKISRVEVTGKESGGTVLRSSVTAGSGSGVGGSCGGVLGIEVVLTNASRYATISHCAVSDTDILSDNDTTGTALTSFYTDCGGIAGHMSGRVEYCDVTDSTVRSTTVGGIVGRPSRKATTTAGTQLTVDHCNLLGETTVGFVGAASSGNSGEAGGMVASARYASVTISNCGIGSSAAISSNHFKYAGGFIGYTVSTNTAYSVKIQNSVMAGTVEIPPLTETEGASSNTDSTVGGAVGYAGMYQRADSTGNTDSYLMIDNCVIGGTLKITDYYAGGVIGTLKSYGTSTNQKVFQIQDCTISATLSATTTYRAKLIGFNEGSAQNATNRWSGTNNIKRALKRNIYSTYPQNLEALGYFRPTSGSYSGQLILMGSGLGQDNVNLATAALITAGGMIEDINRPNGGTNYHNDNSSVEVITGTRTYTILVTNTTSSALVTFDDSDGAAPNDEKKYGGWMSANQNCEPANSNLEVADTSDATTIDLAIKHDATNVGVMAYYTVTGKTDPETGDPMQIPVWIPLTLSQIPAAAIGGDGSQADPWEIPDLETLNSLRNRDLSAGKYYEITADISCGNEAFTPIPGPFCATLYGNNYTISGMTISGTATGIFEETDGATIQDLTISGSTVTGTGLNVDDVTGDVSGQYASALVGKANATTFSNITVTGSTVGGTSNAAPSAYAGAIAAYATDCKAEKITLNNDTVRFAYFTGGVFGHAHYTGAANKECSILGTTVIGLTVASTELTTATKYDGENDGKVDAAGGIVAEFAGTIGDYTNGGTTVHTTLNSLASPAVAVSVTGSTAGGAVGITDCTRTGAASPCVINNVTIGDGTTVTSNRVLLNQAGAGGILGKICSSDPDGAEGTPATDPAMPVTITGCTIDSGASVSAKYFAGGILGHSGANGSASKITITSCESYGSVSADQSGSAVGAIAGRIFDLSNIDFQLCVASGDLTAMTTVGGMIGLVPADYDEVEVPGIYSTTPARISNSVFSATLTATGSGGLRGVIIGSVPTSVLPTTGLTGSPFVNIYYSSYQVPSDLRTTSGGAIKLGKLSGENAYINFQNSVIDLMTNFAFTTDGTNYSSQLRVPLAGTVLSPTDSGANSISLWTGKTSGSYLSFVCPANVPFVLEELTSEPNLITFDSTTGMLSPNAGANDTGDLIFTYANGLKLKLDLIASDIKGSGTSNDPFLIERIGHLNAVKSMPHANYVLAADLDFASSTTDRNAPLTATELSWASNWESWAKDLTRTATETVTVGGSTVTRYVYRFDGTLIGEWYPYNGGNTNYGYDHTAEKVPHVIKNLSVTNDGTFTPADSQTAVDVGYYGAGLFPIIEVGATVSKLEFQHCSFSATNASSKTNNIGVLCAENYGNVSYITVDGASAASGEPNAAVSSVALFTSGNNELQSHHVGAVAGVSYTTLSHCTVRNMTVSSSHCAGGVVGGGKGVTDSTVTNTEINGREQAGGIAGSNLNYTPDANHDIEVPQNASHHATTGDLRTDMCDCVYTNCHVAGCTVQSDAANIKSSVGGILGIAESGDQWNDRSVTFQHCTIDCVTNTHNRDSSKETTVQARAAQGGAQENFAGGMLGQVIAYYDGIVIENCATYASVYAYGVYGGGNYKTSAAALIGMVSDSTNYKPYNGTLNFRFINNICGGDLHSAYLAGGICGYYAPANISNTVPADSDFVCGNVISCSFERLGESSTGNTSTSGLKQNRGFGIVMGACKSDSFASDSALSTIKDNYYSSYVSKESDDAIPAFSAKGDVTVGENTVWTGLYDVAKYGEYKSSFLVVNKVYYQPEDTTVWRLKDSDNSLEDSVTPPVIAGGTSNIYPGHNSTDPNDSSDYSMRMQLKFDTGSNTTSVDFADPNSSLTVYSTGIASADLHILGITEAGDIFVNPDNGTDDFYGGARALITDNNVTKNAAQLTVRNDPELCASRYNLIADLGYGLHVGIAILTNVGTGEIDNPWKIPDAKTFAHFFFSDAQLMKNNNTANRAYLSEYYAQTGDFDWDDVLLTLSGDPDYAYRTGEKYGYVRTVNGVDTFTEFKNSPEGYTYLPIGDATYPFTGGYDGGWNFDPSAGRVRSTGAGHKITNFHFTAPAGMTDVGLFGYVYETSSTNHHFKNIHIELPETALDSVNLTPTGTEAGIFGGINTGALCGRYVSGTTIDNCSVVYGTVRSDNIDCSVGGLIGKMAGSATMQNCFTSCNVRARADGNISDKERYACGGLVGSQEGNAASLSDAADYPCSFVNCFTSSDVVGPALVGGFVGQVGTNTFVNLTNCSSTATVTAIDLFTDRANTIGPTLVVGRRPSEGLQSSAYQEAAATPKYVMANNVFVAGMNTTEFRFRDNAGKQFFSTLFGMRGLRDGSGGIYYDSTAIGRITVPNGTATPNLIKVSGALSDGYANELGSAAPYTAMKTEDLTKGYAAANPNADPPTPEIGANLGSAFDSSDTSLYPVLRMANRGSENQNASDPYYDTFSMLSAMPMFADSRELDDVTADRSYTGVIYPTRVSKSLGGDAVTIVSSKFTADPATPSYPDAYDYLLEGNDHRTDMDTDLLFNRGAGSAATDSANTAEYSRTDTRSDYLILRNTSLAYNSSATALQLSTTRDQRSPFVRIMVGDVHRTIRVGLRNSGNTSYVSTERQLRAISHHETAGKFATAYANTLSDNHNIRICADIDFNPKVERRTTFIPIGEEEDYNGSSTGDQDEGAFGFDGGNCEIRNMYIADRQYAGLFSRIKSGADYAPKIQNLVLRNPTVSGSTAAGALAGAIERAGTQIKNCSVIGGRVTASAHNSNVGGLVGTLASGNNQNLIDAQWISVIGTSIVTTPQNSITPVNAVGLMFGNTSNATISNSYAVGELNGINAKSVGGISGVAAGTTASGVVTSGYIGSSYSNATNQAANDGAVGGIFGKTSSSSVVNNAISTAFIAVTSAFISGEQYYGGIVGWPTGGSILNTIFAGSTVGGPGEESCFISYNAMPPTVRNVCYDRSLQFTDLEESYHPLTTWQIVSGSGTGSVFNDSTNPASFQYDTTSYRYYPNPIDMRGYKAPYGEISNVISDSFRIGLGFALARINTAYGGAGGSVTEYDEISVTSPINAIGSQTSNGLPDGPLTGYMTIGTADSDDTVALAEYSTANTTATDTYLAESGGALVPHIFDEAAYTGVRATMNTATGDPTFTDATLYRFLIVDLCRIAEIEYTVSYDDTADALDRSTEIDRLVLMLKTKQKLKSLYKNSLDASGNNAPELTFSSNAVTSKFQDSDETPGSGTNTVKYRKICVPSDNKIYVGSMLPSQYKVSGVKAYEYDFANGIYKNVDLYDGTNQYILIPSDGSNLADTKIRIDVAITADPSWGLRDLDGGIG